MKLPSLLATLLVAAATSLYAEEKVVVYNWAEYISEDSLAAFTQETGIKVEYSTYDNNETMYSKLKLQQGKGYDIVVPSTYLVSKMRAEGLLQEIDHKKLTNLPNLSISLMNKDYDPGNKYSIPYLWGSTGIAVNSKEIDPATIKGWADLWDSKWQGKLLLIDDLREVFHMALKKNGYSTNTTNPDELKTAYEDLQKLMPNVRVFNADSPRQPYLSGDVNLGMIWSGELIMAQQENPDIQYIFPQEGAGFWVDSFSIPAGAENVENAHKFIDYMLRADVGKKVVEELGYSTPNGEVRNLLDGKYLNNKVIFPPAEAVDKGEFQKDVGEAMKLYNEYWEKLKAGK
ncbi:MAG TPA: extracellular solute-binding protein [Candidatus Thiothrix moscowensis]|uniref:extracellular solute-binding protein n=1 Tax=unclassified Thiothrix TaxID=2636184 RepID=UPI0025F03002|nr:MULTISPECIES: extracellular solute-binding protein [unclassified Thiothrix]HRJ52573.1 extracellular solute-binding protein [Candidatus Thiothrix moscowensis]HRJ94283.1 extracellular solute-binding protein [Candidatus Thiothrix moscowensis]